MQKFKIVIITLVFGLTPLFTTSLEDVLFDPEYDSDYYMYCHTEIPSGETWTLAYDFLNELIDEMNAIQNLSSEMHMLQKEMNEMAAECTLDPPNCRTVCTLVCGEYGCTCIANTCVGAPCTHREKIGQHYARIRSNEQQIQVHRQNVDDMMNKNDVDLCKGIGEDIDLNKDIRLDVVHHYPGLAPEVVYNETEKCEKDEDPEEGSAKWRWLTRREYIQRKLDFARMHFMSCHSVMDLRDDISEEEASEIEILMSCYEALAYVEDMELNSKYFEEVDDKRIYICTDPHNWFCCQ